MFVFKDNLIINMDNVASINCVPHSHILRVTTSGGETYEIPFRSTPERDAYVKIFSKQCDDANEQEFLRGK